MPTPFTAAMLDVIEHVCHHIGRHVTPELERELVADIDRLIRVHIPDAPPIASPLKVSNEVLVGLNTTWLAKLLRRETTP